MNVIDKKLTYNRSFRARGKKQVHNLISFVVLHFVYMEKSNVERYYFLRIGCDFALSFCFGSCVPFIHVYWISPTFWISDAFMPLIYEVSNNPNVTTRHHVIQARIYESQTSLHSIKMDVSKILLGHFFLHHIRRSEDESWYELYLAYITEGENSLTVYYWCSWRLFWGGFNHCESSSKDGACILMKIRILAEKARKPSLPLI